MKLPVVPRARKAAAALFILLGTGACLAASPELRARLIRAGAPAPSATAPPAATCPSASEPPHYETVAAVFERHCNKCHDKNRADNAGAQRVFESSSYPFSTNRPDSLLQDLRHMFESRGGIGEEDRCAATRWIDGGGLDDNGDKPRWREASAR